MCPIGLGNSVVQNRFIKIDTNTDIQEKTEQISNIKPENSLKLKDSTSIEITKGNIPSHCVKLDDNNSLEKTKGDQKWEKSIETGGVIGAGIGFFALGGTGLVLATKSVTQFPLFPIGMIIGLVAGMAAGKVVGYTVGLINYTKQNPLHKI